MSSERYDAKVDIVPGMAFVAMGAVVMFLSTRIAYSPSLAGDILGPSPVPMYLGGGLILSGAAVCARSVVLRRKLRAVNRVNEVVHESQLVSQDDAAVRERDTKSPGPAGAILGGGAALACAAYYFLLPWVGFAIATPPLLIALGLVADGAKQWLKIVAFSIVTSALILLLFIGGMGVRIDVLPAFM